ncbi:MAG: hypothetical protein P9L99_15695 [Candidatus Lernaella stagnicola]|nr:hypothetical protein [Candidatus Lernaella stagnicola]
MSDKKSLTRRMKKAITKRAMEFLATPEGLQTVGKILKTKKQFDKIVTEVLGAAGLPSLRDKQQVEWAVDRQNRRIRDMADTIAEVDAVIDRLEQQLTQGVRRAAKPRQAAAQKPIVARPEAKVIDLGAARRASAKKKAGAKRGQAKSSAEKPAASKVEKVTKPGKPSTEKPTTKKKAAAKKTAPKEKPATGTVKKTKPATAKAKSAVKKAPKKKAEPKKTAKVVPPAKKKPAKAAPEKPKKKAVKKSVAKPKKAPKKPAKAKKIAPAKKGQPLGAADLRKKKGDRKASLLDLDFKK